MSATHTVTIPIPAEATAATVRGLLDHLEQHAPTEAVVSGTITATWSTDPVTASVRNTTTSVGFGPQPADGGLAYGQAPGHLGGDPR